MKEFIDPGIKLEKETLKNGSDEIRMKAKNRIIKLINPEKVTQSTKNSKKAKNSSK